MKFTAAFSDLTKRLNPKAGLLFSNYTSWSNKRYYQYHQTLFSGSLGYKLPKCWFPRGFGQACRPCTAGQGIQPGVTKSCQPYLGCSLRPRQVDHEKLSNSHFLTDRLPLAFLRHRHLQHCMRAGGHLVGSGGFLGALLVSFR